VVRNDIRMGGADSQIVRICTYCGPIFFVTVEITQGSGRSRLPVVINTHFLFIEYITVIQCCFVHNLLHSALFCCLYDVC
jgi:hypothetical protein